uniref:Semialdehyde dehydrogenase NAD-binding domain-containing protein n=1 Tax=Chaetoceros debilis TaxID=122233 RepID=A0A7S3PXA1_9STRA
MFNKAVLLTLLIHSASAFAPNANAGLRYASLSTSYSSSSPSALDMSFKVFIDGEAGTTGLQVRDRLSKRDDIEVISPPSDLRKDNDTRKKFINEADAVILCLPDEASIEAASWVEADNDRTVLIDASTAFRVDETWTYGFPELSKEQRKELETSKRISNPGCYPTGFVGLTRPLVEAGILPEGTPLTVNAISGYSGGGKGLMSIFEDSDDHEPWGGYGYSLQHKHIPEMAKYSKLGKEPIFQPQIAAFDQGMVVSVPLHYAWLKEGTTGKDMHDALSKYYEDSTFISVMPAGENAVKDAGLLERGAFLRPDTLKNTNKMELFVFFNDDAGQAVLCARLDNLGKGASGAAVQNLNIALGVDETTGL